MDENEDLAEYNLLITRSKAHFRVTAGSSETKSTPVRKSDRNEKYGLFCKTYKNEKYLTSCCFLWRTPYLMADFQPQAKEHAGKNNVTEVASDIILQWISCNICTMTCRSVVNKLEAKIETYRNLKKYPFAKRRTTFYMKLKQFCENCEQFFDIKCGDEYHRKKRETLWNVKQMVEDLKFYKNQLAG